MEFTPEQLAVIKSENPQTVFELKDLEVLAFFSLAQMHKKVVRMTDNFFGNTRVGVFTIDELNGKTDLDFSNPDDWTTLNIESISFTLALPNEWGSQSSTYHSLFEIKAIALLETD
ncbi:MAG TPA: hypothetical protein VK623_05300 [Flavobacterium sp.]|nr:hypothetical protein [Flavobacterium sp.]